MTPPTIEGFHVRTLDAGDIPHLQVLFDEDPEYFEANGRKIPVEEIVNALPPTRTLGDKFLFTLERAQRIEGILDIIRGYPEANYWFLGFIFLSKRVRGAGQGRKCLRALYPWMKSQGGEFVRLGVVEPNLKARHLYLTEGFRYQATRPVDPAVNRMRPTLVLDRSL